MKLFTLSFCLFTATLTFAQPAFLHTFGSPGEYFRAKDVTANGDNGFWVLAEISTIEQYDTDLILYQMSLQGNIIDSIQLYAPGNQHPGKITTKQSGDILISGLTDDLSDGRDDVLLNLVDQEGQSIWSTKLGGPYDDLFIDAFINDLGNSYVLYEEQVSFATYEARLAKLDESGNELWQLDLSETTFNLFDVNRIVSLPNDELLLLGLDNDEAVMKRIDAEGQVIWSVNSVPDMVFWESTTFTDAHFDQGTEKIIVHAQSDFLANRELYIYDLDGNQLSSYNIYLGTNATKEDKLILLGQNLMVISRNYILRFEIYLENNHFEYSEVYTSLVAYLYLTGAKLNDNKMAVIRDDGRVYIFDIFNSTLQKQVGFPIIDSYESIGGLSINNNNTLAVGRNTDNENVITSIAANGSAIENIDPIGNHRLNDILTFADGTTVRSYISLGLNTDVDTIGYRVYDGSGALINTYAYTAFTNLSNDYSITRLERHGDNGFVMVYDEYYGVGSVYIFRADTPTTTDVNVTEYSWSNLFYLKSVDQLGNGNLLVSGTSLTGPADLSTYEINAQGELQSEQIIAIPEAHSVLNFDLSVHPFLTEYSIAVTYKKNDSSAHHLSVLKFNTQGDLLQNYPLVVPSSTYYFTIAVEYLSNGNLAIVNSFEDRVTTVDDHRSGIVYRLLDENGNETLQEKSYTPFAQIWLYDSDLSQENIMLIGGQYQIERDYDALVFTVNTMGKLTHSAAIANQATTIRLWPNPTSDKVYFTFDGGSQKQLHLSIWNSAGQQVYSKFMTDGQPAINEIDLSHLNNGQYWLLFSSENERQVLPLIKN